MKDDLAEFNASESRSGWSISDGTEDSELYSMLTGGESSKSSSGVRVNRIKALNLAEVWRAVSLISSDVARIPLEVLRRSGAGKEVMKEHPAWGLLRKRPHPFYNYFTWKQTAAAHVLMHGNHYSLIDRNLRGDPVALLILDPQHTWWEVIGGELWYNTYIPDTQQLFRVDPSRIVHFMNLSYDGRAGYSVLSLAADSFGFGLAARDFGARFFSNGARPSIILKHPGKLSETAKSNLRESWERLYSGTQNAHRTAVVEEGMEAQTIGQNAEESQLLESREFTVREIANWFCVPPHKLGDPTKTSYNSLEQENEAYLNESLDSRLVMMEAELESKLLTQAEQNSDDFRIEFNRDAIVRIDLRTRTEVQTILSNNGMLNLDEVRSQNNMPPLPDGLGQHFRIPANIITLGVDRPGVDGGDDATNGETPPGMTPTQSPAQPAIDDARDAALRELLADVTARTIRKVTLAAMRRAKNGERFFKWVTGELDDHRQHYADLLRMVVRIMHPDEDVEARVAGAVEMLFAALRERLLSAAECTEPELCGSVKRTVDAAAVSLSVRVVSECS